MSKTRVASQYLHGQKQDAVWTVARTFPKEAADFIVDILSCS